MSQKFMGHFIIPCVVCGRSHVIYTTGRVITPSAVRRVSSKCAKRHGHSVDIEDARACADALRGVRPAAAERRDSYILRVVNPTAA